MDKIKIFKYGDDVNTDIIIPARYLNDASTENLKAHALEDLDENFSSTVKEGDIVVAGENFGCGSSREHAPLAIKASGVKLVVAKSFARIFYRNAINVGLYLVESAEIADNLHENDSLTIDNGIIHNLTTGKDYTLPAVDDFVKTVLDKGGLLEAIK